MYFFISSFSPSSSLIYFLSHPLPLSTLSISLSFSFSLSISLLPRKLLCYSRFANIGLVQTVLFGCSSQFAEFPQCQSPQIYVYVGIKDTLNAKPLKTIQKLQGGRSYKTKDMHFRLFNSIYRLQIMYPFLLYDGLHLSYTYPLSKSSKIYLNRIILTIYLSNLIVSEKSFYTRLHYA